MGSLGGVTFTIVEEERVEYAAEATERAVEQGADIVDHIRPRPVMLAVSGVVLDPGASGKLAQIRDYAQKGELLTYSGLNVAGNMVIISFPAEATRRIANGFAFRLELREVRIATSKTVAYVAPDPVAPTAPGVAAQSNPPGPAGLQLPHPSQRPDALYVAKEVAPSLLVRATDYLSKVFQ